jgi:F0F1-type ATP synthase membrane subunit b/b'
MNVLARHSGSSRSAVSCLALCLTLLGAFGCERTREAFQQDTEAATAQARESAEEAKLRLEREVGDFKTQANAKLEQLSVSINGLGARAQENVDGSRADLQQQLAEARARVSQLKADGSTQWQQSKTELDQRIADLGKRLKESLDGAGAKLDSAGEKVQHALQPSEQKPEEK